MRRIISLLLTFTVFSAAAQSVGLVLSGGGAKGLYHIGLIKALEENNIPIDYVAGTSMGSIVSGLYAIGYSPQEMEALFLSPQINLWMTGKIESRYFFYFKRMASSQAMITLNLDFKSDKGVAKIPVNVIPSTQIDLSFNEIFGPAAAKSGGDFDNFLVPFRCVAADVFNKKEVVFREGDIGYAIRASMSIPLAFPPMRADSVLLYDGGLYNNFPWQVVEEDFNPDIIIGGKCVKGMQNPDPNSLTEQIEAIMTMHTDFSLPEDRGIMIERIFDDISMLDFSRAQYIIDMGYKDAMAKMDSIKARIPRRVNSTELYNRRLAYKSDLPVLVFDDYRINGLNSSQKVYVRNQMGVGGSDRKFSFPEFKSEYFKILSEGDIVAGFPTLDYNDSTGFFTAVLNLSTKPSFRVKLGGNVSSTSLNQAYVGAEYKIIGKSAHSMRFDGNFSAFYTSIAAGARSDVYLGRPFYYDLFVNYNMYNHTKSNYKTLFRSYGFNQSDDLFMSLSMGFPTGRSSVFKIRTNAGKNYYKYFEAPSFTEQNYADKTKFRYWGVKVESLKNTLDYTLYPKRGITQNMSLIYVSGREVFIPGDIYPGVSDGSRDGRAWFGAKYSRQEYREVTKWLSLGYHIEGVYTNHPSFSNYHSTILTAPEFTPTIHSKALLIDKFRADAYLAVGLIPTIEFTSSLYLKNALYLFQPKEFEDFEEYSNDRMRYIINSSLVYQTPIGPASLTFATYEAGRKNWYVVFNFGYTIFNKKGLFY